MSVAHLCSRWPEAHAGSAWGGAWSGLHSRDVLKMEGPEVTLPHTPVTGPQVTESPPTPPPSTLQLSPFSGIVGLGPRCASRTKQLAPTHGVKYVSLLTQVRHSGMTFSWTTSSRRSIVNEE